MDSQEEENNSEPNEDSEYQTGASNMADSLRAAKDRWKRRDEEKWVSDGRQLR